MTILYFFLALLALGLLIFLHELGHLIVARWTGMKVEVFSIGFGKAIFSWKWKEVVWQIGILPFGGYVKISGMEFSKGKSAIDPYKVEGGYFTKAPWKRIFVALAGPLANFLVAILLFTLIFVLGGREKPFTEITHIIGWVDPNSELYAQGVRPGDTLATYNGKPYKGAKDLLIAAMAEGKKVEISGIKINYSSGEKSPYSFIVEPYSSPYAFDEEIKTTGILSPARFLIFGQEEIPPGSPMLASGIKEGDRLVWMDGEILFSMEELNFLLSRNFALITFEREGKIFLTRQPRTVARDLLLSPELAGDLSDWQHEIHAKRKWQELYILPYDIDTEAVVRMELPFLDKESEQSRGEREGRRAPSEHHTHGMR